MPIRYTKVCKLSKNLRRCSETLNTKLLERRTDLLKNRSLGLSLSETVQHLAEKYDVSEKLIYYDWRVREKWMEGVLGIADNKAFLCDLLANHKELYRLTLKEYLGADNSAAKIGALRLLRDLNMDFHEMVVTKGLYERVEKLEEGSG